MKHSGPQARGGNPPVVAFKASPSPTQREFILWRGPGEGIIEKCIMGPRGEGKTESGIMAMTYHADMQPPEVLPLPYACIRDTFANLERTTLRSLLFPRAGSFAAALRGALVVRNGGRNLELPGLWTLDMFGMDNLGDLSKLQSLQLAGLWVEEAAPAAVEDIGGGMQEEAVKLGLTCLRHPATWRQALVTMNYPDEDHWTWQRYHERPTPRRKLFRILKGENAAVDDAYRQSMAEALADDPSLLARLVEGQAAFVQTGEAVTPEYNPDLHRSRVALEPLAGVQGIRGWDGGLSPTCHIVQVTGSGRILGLDTLRGEHIGVEQLIEAQLKPLLSGRYAKVTHWRDIGDPSMTTPDPSDSRNSPAAAIERLLERSPGQRARFEPGPVRWEPRREAVKALLNQMVDGLARYLLNPQDKIMHRALRGGWHYYKDSSGRVLRDKPVKDIHSHPGDVLAYLAAMLLNWKVRTVPLPQTAETAFSPFDYNQGRVQPREAEREFSVFRS